MCGTGLVCNSPIMSDYTPIFSQVAYNFNISGLKSNFICNDDSNRNYIVYTESGENMGLELTRNLNKLKMIENLKLGEDGSITFSTEFMSDIASLLYPIEKQPEVFPNFRGNIQLEYEEDNGKYLEIEITPDMKMNIFKIDEDGNEYENDDYFKVDLDEIQKEVNAFYGC